MEKHSNYWFRSRSSEKHECILIDDDIYVFDHGEYVYKVRFAWTHLGVWESWKRIQGNGKEESVEYLL